jgi:hypothetical protein
MLILEIVFFVNKRPKKLIKINPDNVTNQELITVFSKYIVSFSKLSITYSNFLIEIDSGNINFVTL